MSCCVSSCVDVFECLADAQSSLNCEKVLIQTNVNCRNRGISIRGINK
jgi:hypothetical protein